MRVLFFIYALSMLINHPSKGLEIKCGEEKMSRMSILISRKDIGAYDWSRHEVILNDAAIKRIKKLPIKFNQFCVILNGEILYKGKFENAVKSSIGIECPSILIAPNINCVSLIHRCHLKIWYMGKSPDPREDDKLKEYLQNENLLK